MSRSENNVKRMAFNDDLSEVEKSAEDDILLTFTTDTTLHGLKNACKRNTHMIRRILWVVVILCMVVGCTVMITRSTIKYLEFESLTSTTKLLNTSLDFPSVTVCNFNMHKLSVTLSKYPQAFRYNTLLNKKGLQGLNATEELELVALGEVLKNISLGRYMEDVKFTPRDMFVNCYFNYGSINKSCWDFLTPLYTDRGICQTFQSKEFIAKHGAIKVAQPGPNFGLTMTLNVMKNEYYFGFGLGYGMLILVHDPNVYPLMEQKGFGVSPGSETLVAIEKFITKRLSKPYSVQDCVDTTLVENSNYSREHCLFACLSTEMYGNQCVYGKTCSLYDAHTAENNLKIIGDVILNCDCKPTCVETFYQYRVTAVDFPNNYALVEAQRRNWTSQNLTYIKENYAHIKIYFDTFEYVTNEQRPAITLDQIVADVGGQLGICLGASIITLAEFFDYGILGMLFFYKKLKKRSVAVSKSTTTTPVSPIRQSDI